MPDVDGGTTQKIVSNLGGSWRALMTSFWLNGQTQQGEVLFITWSLSYITALSANFQEQFVFYLHLVYVKETI